MSDGFQALVASSDPEQSQILATILGHCGLQSVLCSSLTEARATLAEKPIRLVFCEDHLVDGSYRDFLKVIADSKLGVPLITFSHLADWELYMEAIQSGAFDCIGPSFQTKEIERIVYTVLTGNDQTRSNAQVAKATL